MKRTREEAEQTREEIFQAGIRLLSTKGIHETSMAAIAREAGVSRGAIYWHFRNKEDLLREIRGRLNLFYTNLAESTAKQKVPIAAGMGSAVRTLFEKYRNDGEYRRLQDLQLQIGILYAGDDSMRDEMDEQKNTALNHIREALTKGALVSAFPPDHLFMIMESFIGGLLVRQYIRQEALSDSEIASAADFLTRGIESLETNQNT